MSNEDRMEQHETIENARVDAWPLEIIIICQGEPRCTEEPYDDCKLCMRIRADDRRSTRQILNEMRRSN